MRGILGLICMRIRSMRVMSTMRMQLLRAIRTLKIMALTGNRKTGNEHNKHGK